MIELPKNRYQGVSELLTEVGINHLFARSVLEERVDGIVYTDSIDCSNLYYIVHPYGMSLLFGDPSSLKNWSGFWSYLMGSVGNRTHDEWLQAFPEAISNQVCSNLGFSQSVNSDIEESGHFEKHVRVNYRFDPNRLSVSRNDDPPVSRGMIVRTGKSECNGLKGAVIPSFFWKSIDDFLSQGVGFSLVIGSEVVSTAFSAFIHGKKLELGIETMKKHQGNGYAYQVCSRLIEYCLMKGYEPIWSCRMGNVGSVKLAEKLGFVPVLSVPYFRLRHRID